MAALGGVAREVNGGLEVGSRDVALSAAELELAERRAIERICRQSLGTGDALERIDARVRPGVLGNRDRTIERDDRRWREHHQAVVQLDDGAPVRARDTRRLDVGGRDRGLEVVHADLAAARRLLEQSEAVRYQRAVPGRSILVDERAQIAGAVEPAREARRVQAHERRERVRRWRAGTRIAGEELR